MTARITREDGGIVYWSPKAISASADADAQIRSAVGTLWERVAEDATWRKVGHPHNGHNASVAASQLLGHERGRTALITVTGDKADDRLDWNAFGVIRAGKRVK